MLPHNARGRELFRHLNVYAGADHPHEAQVNAGTGARAKKRARQAEAAASAAPAVAAPVEETPVADAPPVEATASEATEAATTEGERLTGSLSRFKRADLDAEAERLGIEIEAEWKKDDVVAAVQAHYDENPAADGGDE
jgi:hypothetical protein